MNDITKSLDYIRTLQKQEKAQENSDLWAAILAIVYALEAANITVPEIHAQKAQESLVISLFGLVASLPVVAAEFLGLCSQIFKGGFHRYSFS